jgi:hypothetical protein
MVFNLVNRKLLGKTEKDRKEDFAGGYDFHTAFLSPYLPGQPKQEPAPAKPRKKSTRARRPQPNSET